MHRAVRFRLITVGLLVSLRALASGLPSADQLLDRAIAHYDPAGLWMQSRATLTIDETRPEGPSRRTIITTDPAAAVFAITTTRGDAVLEGTLHCGSCSWKLDGSTAFSPELRDRHRLTCDRLFWLRDYYEYLWGLPMKLRDPGTRLGPAVREVRFAGRASLEMRVTYDSSVGSDTWYFYFDPDSAALVGYRFYHDETVGDGEYIVLDGELTVGHLRLPRSRAWYSHEDGAHLGTDHLIALELEP